MNKPQQRFPAAPLTIVLAYAAFSALWIILSDRVVDWLITDRAIARVVHTFKGWAFVAVTSLLLYSLLRRLLSPPHTHELQPMTRSTPLFPLAVVSVSIVLLVSVAVIHNLSHQKETLAVRLQTIADLKTRQIANWIQERSDDARFAQSSRLWSEQFSRWRSGDGSLLPRLEQRLKQFCQFNSFQSMDLLDSTGSLVMVEPAGSAQHTLPLPVALQEEARKGVARFGPYRDRIGRLHLDFIVKLVDNGPYLILHTDPSVYLYPVLQSWPLPSDSGETLLFRQDGDQVQFLNELRHRSGSAVNLRIPVATTELLAGKLLRGEVGLNVLVEGRDYRGVPVLGVARRVPGTDWFLVAKMDRAELLRESSSDLLWIVLAGAISLCAALVGIVLFRQREELATAQREQASQADKLRALQLLDAIANSSSDAIYAKDLAGRYLLCNRAACAFLGVDSEQVLNQQDDTLFQPEDVATITANNRLVVQENRQLAIEEQLTLQDGQHTFLTTLGPLHDASGSVIGTYGISRDISERKRAEQALRESELRFSRVFHASPVGIGLTRLEDGRFLDVNDALLAMFGLRRDELLGRTSVELGILLPEERDEIVATLRAGQPVLSREMPIRRRDGEPGGMLLSMELLEAAGVSTVLSMAIDISDYKRAEAERELLQEQLQQAQKMESVGRLAGGVAHDFNNMLAVIIGNAELALMQQGLTGKLHDRLEEIKKAAGRSADLTRQLLAFARKQTAVVQVLDLNIHATDMLAMLQRLIGEQIELVWQPGEGLWPVEVDPAQIDQILANLTVNARDAIAGHGRILIETRNIHLAEVPASARPTCEPGDYVLLAVRDTGCGMGPEVLEHLFEPFFTTKGLGRGTGLGLATVYGIVQQNRGFITVASLPDVGTTISICLPRCVSADVSPIPKPDSSTSRSRGETVLLVEDELALLQLTKQMLEELGYRVISSNNPREAIQLAKANPGAIDLLLTDLVMPELNGHDLVSQLLAADPSLKYLIMSGYTADSMGQNSSLESGGFLAKPFSLEELARRVRQALDQRS